MAEPPPDDELVDVYDDTLNKVGVVTRNEAHRKGYWHLNLHCWIVTKRKGGAVIFQVRSERQAHLRGASSTALSAATSRLGRSSRKWRAR